METKEMEIQKVFADAETMLVKAEPMAVTDQKSYDVATNMIKEAKSVWKVLEKARKEEVEPWSTEVKRINARYGAPQGFLEKIEEILNGKLKAFMIAERDKQQKAQLALQQAAEISEQDRQASLARVAEKADASGAPETAAAARILAEQVYPVARAAQTFVPQGGMALKPNWKWEVVDMEALMKAILAGEVDAKLVEPNGKLLTAIAKGSQGGVAIPGVKWTDEGTLAVSTI